MATFWDTIDRPIYALAPMAGVTDAAFRRIWAKYGKPDVMMTEFVSCDGLCSTGREKLLHDLWYSEQERPIVAQIFTSLPENMRRSAALIRELGFDGIDINAGCPDRNVEKQGAGAALTRDPILLQQLVQAAREGSDGLPISVKTRLGYDAIDIDEWAGPILEADPAAFTVHLRTRQEMSKVDAHWDFADNLVAICRRHHPTVPILGNGDVQSLPQADELAALYGVDGIMIGRGVYGNPWLFNPDVPDESVTVERRLEVMLEHSRLYLEIFGDRKNFAVMKKHYKAYVAGFEDAKELRIQLMEAASMEEVEELTAAFLARRAEAV